MMIRIPLAKGPRGLRRDAERTARILLAMSPRGPRRRRRRLPSLPRSPPHLIGGRGICYILSIRFVVIAAAAAIIVIQIAPRPFATTMINYFSILIKSPIVSRLPTTVVRYRTYFSLSPVLVLSFTVRYCKSTIVIVPIANLSEPAQAHNRQNHQQRNRQQRDPPKLPNQCQCCYHHRLPVGPALRRPRYLAANR